MSSENKQWAKQMIQAARDLSNEDLLERKKWLGESCECGLGALAQNLLAPLIVEECQRRGI